MARSTEAHLAYYTEKAGDVMRQLSFAAIAMIWLFHSSGAPADSSALAHPMEYLLRLALIFVATGLLLDATQYFLGSILWNAAYIRKPEEPVFSFKWSLWITFFLIYLKQIVLLGGYVLLGAFIVRQAVL